MKSDSLALMSVKKPARKQRKLRLVPKAMLYHLAQFLSCDSLSSFSVVSFMHFIILWNELTSSDLFQDGLDKVCPLHAVRKCHTVHIKYTSENSLHFCKNHCQEEKKASPFAPANSHLQKLFYFWTIWNVIDGDLVIFLSKFISAYFFVQTKFKYFSYYFRLFILFSFILMLECMLIWSHILQANKPFYCPGC